MDTLDMVTSAGGASDPSDNIPEGFSPVPAVPDVIAINVRSENIQGVPIHHNPNQSKIL